MFAVSVSVDNMDRIEDTLKLVPGVLKNALRRVVRRETLALERHVKNDKLSGQVLNVRTGTLRRSIFREVIETPTSIMGRVGTNLRYGLAHEFGATIQIPEVRPVNAKALHWTGRDGTDVFAMRAGAHVVRLPERSFLRSALEDRRVAFHKAVADAIRDVVTSANNGDATDAPSDTE